MVKLNSSYSDYTDETDADYPEGKAINASTSESFDGTPLLAEFMNDINSAHIAVYEKAYGKRDGISGVPDTQKNSQFANAVEKLIDTKVTNHEKERGLADGVHGATSEASPGQIVTRDTNGNAKFGVPLANDDAARRGDIYEYTKAVVCTTEAGEMEKIIPAAKYPGFVLKDEVILHVMFLNSAEVSKSDYSETTFVTLNVCGKGAKKIFAKKDDVYFTLKAYDLNDKFRFYQANTEFELIYNSNLDSGNGAWVIVNNPIVLQSGNDTSGYLIYADGRYIYTVDQLKSSLPGVAKTGKYADLLEKPDFLPSDGFAVGVKDYGNTAHGIKIGFTGAGLSAPNCGYLAGYGPNGDTIKDISWAEVESKLGTDLGTSEATGNTLVRRDANGYMYAVYYNSSCPVQDDLEIKNIIYETGDGWFRKVSLDKLKELLMQEIVVTGTSWNDLTSKVFIPSGTNVSNPGAIGGVKAYGKINGSAFAGAIYTASGNLYITPSDKGHSGSDSYYSIPQNSISSFEIHLVP